MIKDNLSSLHKSIWPLDYPILTPSVSFVSLYDSFEADLIHSLGTLTLTDIDHVSIMKFSVYPTPKRGGITGQADPKHASVHGNWTLLDSYIGSIGSKTRRYKETHTWHAKQSHVMRVKWTTALPEKKASPLIPSLSVLSIKFHYIQLIHHGSWLLVWRHQSSIDDFSSHH